MSVSANAARTAPAAKANGNDSVSCVVRDSGPAPITTAKINNRPQTLQVPRMKVRTALSTHRGATHQCFREIGSKDGGQQRDAAAAFPKRDAEHEIFGIPSRVAAANKARPAAPVTDAGGRGILRRCIQVELPAAMIIFPVTLSHPVQPQADHGKHHCPDRQPSAARQMPPCS